MHRSKQHLYSITAMETPNKKRCRSLRQDAQPYRAVFPGWQYPLDATGEALSRDACSV